MSGFWRQAEIYSPRNVDRDSRAVGYSEQEELDDFKLQEVETGVANMHVRDVNKPKNTETAKKVETKPEAKVVVEKEDESVIKARVLRDMLLKTEKGKVWTYLKLGLKLKKLCETLGKFQESEAKIGRGRGNWLDHECSKSAGFIRDSISVFELELANTPIRTEAAIRADIKASRDEIKKLQKKKYHRSGSYIPHADWMGSCDGDADYESFWESAHDRNTVTSIETLEIPILEEELERALALNQR